MAILADTVIIPIFSMGTLKLRKVKHFSHSVIPIINVRPWVRTKGGWLLTTGQGDRWWAG